ncbi:shikimate kinase [Candidatus Bathyarchaeota archaeon]|nr:shikimate kinase [Candidatus Bathyarchaeota archaeon]
MKVILIGYRATGKSTVGKLVSAKLKIPFIDTDLIVENNMVMTIKEIVALHGWDFFRTKEKEAVLTLAQVGACVIATGGGVVLAKENMVLLKQAGVIVWLNAPLHDIISRLSKDAQGAAIRPQFTDWNIVQETIDTMKQRIPLYEKAADHTVDTADKSAADVATEIYQYLLKSGNLAKIDKS